MGLVHMKPLKVRILLIARKILGGTSDCLPREGTLDVVKILSPRRILKPLVTLRSLEFRSQILVSWEVTSSIPGVHYWTFDREI